MPACVSATTTVRGAKPWIGRGEDAMGFVRRLTSNIGMRGKRQTNEGEQRALLEKPRDGEQDRATTRERWRRRAAAQIGSYVGAVQSASQLARKHVAEQLRKGLHAVRSINVSTLIRYLLSFVSLDKAKVYVGVPGIRFRGASRLMSDMVHVYMDVEVVRIKFSVNPRRLRLTRPRLATLRSENLPFTVPDVSKLNFAIGPEDRPPYITITDPGTPVDWKDRLRDELDERPRCWGISEQPIGAGQLINLLIKYGVVGWQVARETKKPAAPDSR
jgi:hypothetical protein